MEPDSRIFRLLCYFVEEQYVYCKITEYEADSEYISKYGIRNGYFGFGSSTYPLNMGVYFPCVVGCKVAKTGPTYDQCKTICLFEKFSCTTVPNASRLPS